MRSPLKALALTAVVLLLCALSVRSHAADDPVEQKTEADAKADDKPEESLFHDPKTGEFDISNWLASRHGFLPVPMIITGPTLGTGGGLNMMFLHGGLTGTKAADGRRVPPTITGVAGAATENGSKAAAVYNLGFWLEDRLRTSTFLARPDINMNFYPSRFGSDASVKMNMNGWSVYQETKVRLGDSAFFAGANYLYSGLDLSPKDEPVPQLKPLLDHDYNIGGLAGVLEYDTRDTIFTPTKGMYGKLVARTYANWLGSDNNFPAFSGKVFKYLPLSENFDLALRVEGHSVGSEAPFFLYPSVEMRGIANKRYQGQHVLEGEAELNWRVWKRWHLIGFIGSGKAFGKNKIAGKKSFSEAGWDSSKGVGFRYNIADKFGIQVGGDVAWGPEDTAFYITVGSAWNSFF